MSCGILEAIGDPVLMARIDERSRLVTRIAAAYFCSDEGAGAWLDEEDRAAMQLFAIGNNIPREILH